MTWLFWTELAIGAVLVVLLLYITGWGNKIWTGLSGRWRNRRQPRGAGGRDAGVEMHGRADAAADAPTDAIAADSPSSLSLSFSSTDDPGSGGPSADAPPPEPADVGSLTEADLEELARLGREMPPMTDDELRLIQDEVEEMRRAGDGALVP